MAEQATTTTPVSQIAARRHERRARADGRDSASGAQWEAILDAAARVFHRVGYASANLDDIATEVGLNRSSIYYYVGSKAELLSELGRRTISENAASLTEVGAQTLTPTDMVRAIIHQQMELLERNYPRVFVFHNERRHHVDPDLNQLIDDAAELRISLLAQAIDDGVASGVFRPGLHGRTTARLIVGMCAETRFWWRPDGPRALVEIGNDIADLVLSGMEQLGSGPRPGRP
jgi:AcrR family transcriptional regulator